MEEAGEGDPAAEDVIDGFGEIVARRQASRCWRCGTMTHDYKRDGTTTLFAALNVLHGTVIGECMPRQRHRAGS
jgi:hypothetical protein